MTTPRETQPRSASSGFEAYFENTEGTVLRPHQITVFEDIQRFFEDGHKRGYISLPTGTGKTVLFVELSRVLLDVPQQQKRPKILVVTPSKDLVHQTMGRSGERGYGRFAPELGVGSYFSDTPSSEKMYSGFLENDVIITTYDSFGILAETDEYSGVPIEHTLIPRIAIPHEGITQVKMSKEELDDHRNGQFSEQLLNSQIYQRMISLYGEKEAIRRIKGWQSYPLLDPQVFDSEFYKRLVQVSDEKRVLKSVKRWKFYPVVDPGIFGSEIYKRLSELQGEREALKIVRDWDSYPLIEASGLHDSKIYKSLVKLFDEEDTLGIVAGLDSYPVIEGSGLLESEIYKRLLGFWGKRELTRKIVRWKSYPVGTGRKLIDNFDIFLLDEAHHVFGESVTRLLNRIPDDKTIIGFTATPQADRFRKLEKYLPYKIHDLGITEAISLNLLAPILPVGLRSGLKIEGSDIYDDKGEYIDSKISYLARDENRNRLVIETAKLLSAHDRGIIISCIAGGGAWHARYLAEQLQSIGLKAEAVYSEIPAKTRQEIYHKFNKGEMDVLTFIGVIGEGWDSDRAKALINARPTRSDIVAKQRLGRITRLNGQLAIAIDIADDFDPENPPVTVADALEIGETKFGTVVGSSVDAASQEQIIKDLMSHAPVQESLKAPFSKFKDLLETLPQLKNGYVLSDRGFPEYAIASRISGRYRGFTPEILDKAGAVSGVEIDKRIAAMDRSTREVYNIAQLRKLLDALPRIDPERYYVDTKGNRWISIPGLRTLFSKRFPDLTSDLLARIIGDIQQDVDWIPAVYEIRIRNRNNLYIATKLFNANQESVSRISETLQNRPIVDKPEELL